MLFRVIKDFKAKSDAFIYTIKNIIISFNNREISNQKSVAL